MPDTLTMRELREERDVLDEFLLEAEGEETPEIASLWERLQGAIEEKAERWGVWVIRRRQDAAAIDLEIKRLQERKRVLEAAADRSEAQLERQLTALGVTDTIKRPLATAGWRNNPESLDCPADYPAERLALLRKVHPEYVRVVPEKLELNKKPILDALKGALKKGAVAGGSVQADDLAAWGFGIKRTRSFYVK